MFFALAGVTAVLNWIAVERKSKALEYFAKPATTALLIAAALALTPEYSSTTRAWYVAALALCLAGDVFLMLPKDLFVPGLASFLVAHVCFVVGIFVGPNQHGGWFPFVTAGIVAFVPWIGLPIVRAAAAQDKALRWPVQFYMAVLVILAFASAGTYSALALPAAAVFITSDYVLARNRFVKPIPHGHLLTMVTYHAALALLVGSLAV